MVGSTTSPLVVTSLGNPMAKAGSNSNMSLGKGKYKSYKIQHKHYYSNITVPYPQFMCKKNFLYSPSFLTPGYELELQFI